MMYLFVAILCLIWLFLWGCYVTPIFIMAWRAADWRGVALATSIIAYVAVSVAWFGWLVVLGGCVLGG